MYPGLQSSTMNSCRMEGKTIPAGDDSSHIHTLYSYSVYSSLSLSLSTEHVFISIEYSALNTTSLFCSLFPYSAVLLNTTNDTMHLNCHNASPAVGPSLHPL